jgi:hypothetical protein
VVSCRQISDQTTCHHIQSCILRTLPIINSSLTRSILGHYNENNHFYPNETAASREQRTIESLLAWLNYAGMHQRRDEVDEAHKDTFRWIFEGTEDHARNTTSVWNWLRSSGKTPFVSWLRKETGLFWIYGKPGAGKTTLMKYLVGDPRLEKHAKVWAGSDKLSVSSFYFWKQGSSIQKSLCGLYRALLWQICNDDQELTRKAFPGWQTSFGATEPGLGALREALNRLLKTNVRGKKYLILIDGLDEYESDDPDARISQVRISEDLLHLVESASVKVIIASRPERAFDSHFSHGRKLAVHDLTARDLELFAQDRLINDKTIRPSGEILTARESGQLRRCVKTVVDKSQGVFLWARIVVDLVCFHICEYHNADQLDEIVNSLPPDLEQLFEEIMKRVLNLKEPERTESLRYLTVTSHWFATFTDDKSSLSQWLPISILGVACELPSHSVTESWIQANKQRLANIGRNETQRISGRIKSCCFGLLETSSRQKHIRPLHRTLVEYFSRLQSAKTLSLDGRESFDASVAVLLALVVMEDYTYPLVSGHEGPSLFRNVLMFNELAEKSTGSAQIAILTIFDRVMKAGFAALVEKHCNLDHDHKVACFSRSSGFTGLAVGEQVEQNEQDCIRAFREEDLIRAFKDLVNDFASNPSHPLASETTRFGGFLDLLAVTISVNCNALLKHWMADSASLGSLPSAEYVTSLVGYALNKGSHHSWHPISIRPTSAALRDEPNTKALQALLQLGGCLETRLDDTSALDSFLGYMLYRTMARQVDRSNTPLMGSFWGLKTLHVLISYGVRQDVYGTLAVVLSGEAPTGPRTWSWNYPGRRAVIEFRGYNVAQILHQITNVLQRESELCLETNPSEMAEIEGSFRCLEERNANAASSRKCSWSALLEAKETSGRREGDWVLMEALRSARETGRDSARYQQFWVPPNAQQFGAVVEWLPYGCREARELSNISGQPPSQHPKHRLTTPESEQRADFEVVGWVVYEFSR